MFRSLLSKRLYFSVKSYCYKPFFITFTKRKLSTISSNITLKVDSDNVVSSPFPDIRGYENTYLHDTVWKNIDKWTERTALVCSITGRTYTYGQVRKLCGKAAMSLRKLKLYPRDTVALIMPNVPEYAIVVLAASEVGLRITTINTSYVTQEAKKLIYNSDAKAIFAVPGTYALAKESIKENVNIKVPIIVIDDGSKPIPSDAIKFDDLMKDDIEEFSTKEKTYVDSEDDVLLPYSSGTTGLPKGVQLSHRNIVANLIQMDNENTNLIEEPTDSFQEIVPVVLPLFHIYGFVRVLLDPMRKGAKLVFLPQFSWTEYIKICKNYQPTLLCVVPTIIDMMVTKEGLKPHYVERVHTVVSSGAPLAEKSIYLYKKYLSARTNIIEGYGMSETSPAVFLNKNAPDKSVGNSIASTQIRIVAHQGANVGRNSGCNEIGEIYVRGPQVMKGYYKNPNATNEAMDGDWLKTGDLGSYDEKGFFYIRGRLKEQIKVKGVQVSPTEIEEVIRSYPNVEDVAVIGVPHEKFGEIPKAFVVPKENVHLRTDEIKDYVAQNLSKHKHLGDVQIIKAIPKTAIGKILRRELQKL